MRKNIPKAVRQQVYEKYEGHCAYCGRIIEYKDMQIDHLEAYWKGGEDDISNYMPACRRCNHYKRGNSLEGWRRMIEGIPDKLMSNEYIYRVALDFNLVNPTLHKVKFYFETFNK